MKFTILLFALLLVVSCKPEKIELISFPDNFYEKCFIDSSKHLFYIVTGKDLYTESNKKSIDSLVVLKRLNNKKYIRVALYKEGWSFSRKDFGQNYEPFGSEWESYLGDYVYCYYELKNEKILTKRLYDTRKLIELNGEKLD